MMQLVQQHQVSPVKNTVECLMHSGHLTARRFSLGTPLTVQNVCKMWWFCIHGPYCYTYWYQKTLFFFYIPLLVKHQCQYMSLCEHFDKSLEPSVNKHEMRIYEEWRHVLFYFFLRRTEKKEREPVMLAATLILLFFSAFLSVTPFCLSQSAHTLSHQPTGKLWDVNRVLGRMRERGEKEWGYTKKRK